MTRSTWSISTLLVWVDNLQLKGQGDGWEPWSPIRSCRNSAPRSPVYQSQPVQRGRLYGAVSMLFIGIRKKKSCPPSLSVEGNEKSWASLCSERINLLRVLDLCGCLIYKAVVYLLAFPHSNCKRVSDVHGLSCSLLWNRCFTDCSSKIQTSTQNHLLAGCEEQPKLRESARVQGTHLSSSFSTVWENTEVCVYESHTMESDYFDSK